jgi:arylsulfatase A-like enzyme/Flp pilus assembly protein TadD
VKRAALSLVCLACIAACGGERPAGKAPAQSPSAKNLVIITIDTLRADRVGAYGYAAARTPAIDAAAKAGVRFTQAYAAAPITLTSHASLMTGRYPAGHGARHNGMRLDLQTPTLADALSRAGFATGGFVGAFPLDRRFGLIKGFQTYGDRMPPASSESAASRAERRGAPGRAVNERPGRMVVDEALAWLADHRSQRVFLWVHLFEPHAPYGNPADPAQQRRPASARYDDEVAEADRQVARVIEALGPDRASTLVVIAADHGESFGEHGEIGHSVFVYDTTLRVPLVMSGPGIAAGRTSDEPVDLIDVAPTAMRILSVQPFDTDGVDLRPALDGGALSKRDLYAESFAPLLDFGWSPLRALRAGALKYIAAPKPELFDLGKDPGETSNVLDAHNVDAASMLERVQRLSGTELTRQAEADPEALARLQALGYASGSKAVPGAARPDPKDRRALAARIAQVASGELQGRPLEDALRAVLKEDPTNPQAHLRLGYVLVESNRCGEAAGHFTKAIAERIPSVDAHLGLAGCEASARRFDAAAATLRQADTIEPDNPVVLGNLGLVLSDSGHPDQAIAPLERALTLDPDLHQARFALALAFAHTSRRAEALGQAQELLRRLPPDAPQRAEVERLANAVK